MQSYLGPPSGSQGSRNYQASGSGASSSRPSQGKGKGKGKAPAQAYAVQASDHHDTTAGTTIDGMLLVSSSWAHVLFDSGASHSFISMLFVSVLGLEYEPLEFTLSMGVPLVGIVSCPFRVVRFGLMLCQLQEAKSDDDKE